MISQLTLIASVALLGSSPVAGSISGVVVNASQDGVPVAGAEVVLRVELEGRLVTVADGIADEDGRFLFDTLPAGGEYGYLPGANRDGIHYPGPRVRLSSLRPNARVKLPVHDAISDPNPLILRRHEITIWPETDALRVAETLIVDNPESRTYVGRSAHGGGRAATLRLSIPSDFRRTTFDNEFYGRQFTLFDNRLATDVPWTPGQRKLAFTYVLPNDKRNRIWQRPLDLPCQYLRLTVHTRNPGRVTCNLGRAASHTTETLTFESAGKTLPAGHVVRLQLGRLPISLATYGRWLALVVLLLFIATTTWLAKPSVARAGPSIFGLLRN